MSISLKFIWIFLVFSGLSQCNKESVNADLPDCLKEKIAQLEKEDCPSVGEVIQYKFKGQIVYVIHPKTCGADLTSEVVDKDCKTICYLGGITGNPNCDGINFQDNATDEKQVYPFQK